MKLLSSLFLFLSLLLLAFQSTESKTPLIKRSVNLRTGISDDYKYDSLGRLLQVQSSRGEKTVFEYIDTLVVKQFFSSPKSKVKKDTFFLNNKNLVILISANIERIMYNKCMYDSRGRLTLLANYVGGKPMRQTYYTWSGDNLKNTTSIDEKGKPQSIVSYSYFTDKPNTISNTNTGLGFLGPESKYLLKESVGLAAVTTSSDTFHIVYHYQMDEKNAVKLKVGYNAKGELVDSTSYSYY